MTSILTVDNVPYNLDEMPTDVDDVRFCILDNSNPKDCDFYYVPLIFLESFISSALILRIGNYTVKMPLDWNILIGSPQCGELEIVPLVSVINRDFDAFVSNPISGFMHQYLPIELVDLYTDIKWYLPKVKTGQLLAIPLSSGPKPDCAYFISDVTRQTEVVDITQIT